MMAQFIVTATKTPTTGPLAGMDLPWFCSFPTFARATMVAEEINRGLTPLLRDAEVGDA